jgi:hypothetical protein
VVAGTGDPSSTPEWPLHDGNPGARRYEPERRPQQSSERSPIGYAGEVHVCLSRVRQTFSADLAVPEVHSRGRGRFRARQFQ